MNNLFDLSNKTVLITGAGFLTLNSFAPAILDYGGKVVIVDNNPDKILPIREELNKKYDSSKVHSYRCDITNKYNIQQVVDEHTEINVVINSACNNPKQSKNSKSITNESRFENFSLDTWNKDIEVGLTGSFLMCQVLGNHFIKNKGGKIINIGSDLALISQDQSLYRVEGLDEDQQAVKPVSYSVLKSGIINLTKYLASYPTFNENNIRVNCVCPGPMKHPDMSDEFVEKLSKKFPIGRLGNTKELQGIIVYLCSENSNFCQGSIFTVDGGRTIV